MLVAMLASILVRFAASFSFAYNQILPYGSESYDQTTNKIIISCAIDLIIQSKR